jgi:hypothetical protein
VNLVVHRYGPPGSTGEYAEIAEHEGYFIMLELSEIKVGRDEAKLKAKILRGI